MGPKRFLSREAGITRWCQYDPVTDTLYEWAEADVEPQIEASRQLQNDTDYWKQGVKREMAHYAHIPNILLEKWANEGVDIRDSSALFAMVNKPEYAYLKTTAKVHIARS